MRSRKTALSVGAWAAFVWIAAAPAVAAGPGRRAITDYRPAFAEARLAYHNRVFLIVRRFRRNGIPFCLAVDPQTLRTAVRPEIIFRLAPTSLDKLRIKFRETPYALALAAAARNALPLQDAGLTRFRPDQPGIDLTVDLCPSSRPLDRALFEELIRTAGAEEKPLPLAVAVTGLWLEHHGAEMDWLVSLQMTGAVDITWINHSFNHRSHRSRPLRRNFMLEPGTRLDEEILNTEAALLERGLTPSVFFRFPGLVSEEKLVRDVSAYGLIIVGSDAWLGKGQWPTNGSIVLVHANGNEPFGIRRFLRLLREEGPAMRSRHWFLFDLRESAVELEKKKN